MEMQAEHRARRNGLGLYWQLLVGAGVFAALFLISRNNYLLFHGIAEIFSSLVAFTIFVLAWHTRRFTDNDYLLFLGIAYLFVGTLDLIHMLAYTGMGVFEGYGTDLATQLWIAARYIEAVSLLLAPFFLARRLKAWWDIVFYTAVFAFVLISIFYLDIFPTCFVEGSGLTPFKRISEYVISLILVAAIAVLIRKRGEFIPRVFYLVVASIAITIVSESCFTLYQDPYAFFNLLGHFLKIISFYLIYLAIIETGLEEPYELLFKELNEKGKRKKAILDATADSLILQDLQGKILVINEVAARSLGKRADELVGADLSDLTPPFLAEQMQDIVEEILGERVSICREYESQGMWYENTYYPALDEEGDVGMVAIYSRDITERRRMEQDLRESEEKFRNIVEQSSDGIVLVDNSGAIVEWNSAQEDILGLGRDEVLGSYLWDVQYQLAVPERRTPEAYDKLKESILGSLQKVYASWFGETSEREVQTPNGERRIIQAVNFPILSREGMMVGSITRDTTRRVRMEEALSFELELNQAVAEISATLLAQDSIDDISYDVLENAKRLTGSPFGYVGYIETDTGYMVSPTLTRDIWEECDIAEKRVVFEEFKGLWGWVLENKEPLLTNLPSEDPRSTGVPHGHIPIERFISVPALLGGALVGQIALANSSRDYDERDIKLLNRLADLYAMAVLRMWSEEELDEYREHLEELVKERTLELEKANRQLQQEVLERRRNQEELRITAERLRALSAHVESVREEERRRLAREVHDTLGQALTGLKINLSLLGRRLSGDSELEERVGSMASLVDATIKSVREIATELRPGVLDDLGLEAALEWQVKRFGEMTGLEAVFVSDAGDSQLDKSLAVSLFRIAQEALTNTARHAEAGRVEVRLAEEQGDVLLEIKDDGRGIEEAEASDRGGLGILGMRERAHMLGGEVEVKGSREAGTSVIVRIPLDPGSGLDAGEDGGEGGG